MANKQLADDLRAARAVIEKPEAWTKDALAKDSDGFSVSAKNKHAACFCALGALENVLFKSPVRWSEAQLALEAQLPDAGHEERVANLNDNPETTHADVLALFDRAIAAAEAS